MNLQSQNQVAQRTLKNLSNLTEVFLKKIKSWSILLFCNKEIKIYYKLKQPFKIDKQKSCFPQLNYVIKTLFTHLKFCIFVYSLLTTLFNCSSHWVCLLSVPCTGCVCSSRESLAVTTSEHRLFSWKDEIFQNVL